MTESDRKPRNLMTPAEVAEVFGVTVGTLAHWRTSGRKGPNYIKATGRVRYRRATVEEWLAAQERASTTEPAP
jgi:predicted site-specific integrase-resolvase